MRSDVRLLPDIVRELVNGLIQGVLGRSLQLQVRQQVFSQKACVALRFRNPVRSLLVMHLLKQGVDTGVLAAHGN